MWLIQILDDCCDVEMEDDEEDYNDEKKELLDEFHLLLLHGDVENDAWLNLVVEVPELFLVDIVVAIFKILSHCNVVIEVGKQFTHDSVC